MPRPNKPRQVSHETHLAERIKIEREKRGLTYERLAEKMTEAGCAMAGSAIFKIENSNPPRRITLNEAVTFAQVFGLKLQELTVPPAIAASREALALWEKYERLTEKYVELTDEIHAVEGRMVNLIETDEAVREALIRQHGDHAEARLENIIFFHRDPRMTGLSTYKKED